MAGRYGADDCFYSLFSSQKRSPSPYKARKTSQEEERTWGNLPIEAGQGRFFPRPAEGHGPQGTRGPEGHGGQGKEGPEAGMRPQMGTISRNAGGRPAEDTGMCRLMLSPQNKDSLPAADRACGLRCSGPRAAGPGRDRQGWKRKKPAAIALSWGTARRTWVALQDAGRKKAPAGQGLSGQRTAAGYDGCRCVMEQAGGGGISCFGVYPSEVGSFLRERR